MENTNNGQANGQQTQKALIVQKLDQLKVALNEDFVQNQLRSALSENSGAFTASLIDLFTTEKTLQGLDPKLIIMQAMKAAVLKLPINKSLGFAWIVPYKGAPQFQIGYKGLVQLALRTGQYRTMNTDVVYDGEYRSSNKLTGEFDLNGVAVSEKIIGYFAHFELLNGFSKTLYMTRDKVIAHAQKYSKSYNVDNSPWKTDFDAMAKKTVVRNLLSHWGYLSVEMANAIQTDVDEDAADRVMREIRTNANSSTMGFEEAETVSNQQTPGAPF
ncbi:MAG: recombinase RecT [Flavisolibacter sp.]|jgi:recombination protein RecT